MSAIPDQKSQILASVERAAAAYDWQTVFERVAEGLEQPGLTAAEAYDLRAARMMPNWFLGDLAARFADAEIMLALAREIDDTGRLVNALHEYHWTHHLLGDYTQAQAIIEEAYALVKTIEDAALQARTLNFLGTSVKILGDTEAARSYHQAALELSRNGVAPYDESWALEFLALLPPVNADPARVDAYLQEALTVAHDAGALMQEMSCLYTISVRSRDFARKRYYLGLARDIAEKIDMPTMLANIENSLGVFYWQLGLFGQAARHAAEAVRLQRQFGFIRDMMFSLDTVGWIALDAGDRHLAQSSFNEILDIARGQDMQLHRQGALAGLGRLVLREGHLVEAESYLKEAAAAYEKAGRPGDQAAALASLAQVYLEQDDPQRALDVSTQAMALAAENAYVVQDSPVQNLWWLRYDVLARAGVSEEEAWEALQAARLAMFEPVNNISDEGLRRNYLNKPPFNHAISEAWAKEAVRRGISLAPFTERETSPAALAEQLERIVASGTRLAVERDTDRLAEFILHEFVELSGVERAIVALRAGAGRDPLLQWTAAEGIEDGTEEATAEFAGPFIDQVRTARTPLLVTEAGDVPAGGIPELHLRSILALPLISHGRLWGVLYGDMRHLFGRLNENDRDILTLLANQAGAALENANWVETLEQQVVDRTAELNERVDELQVINSVQQGLAAEFDFQAIVDLVGNKLIDVFQTDSLGIDWYDHGNNLIHYVFAYEKGKRLELPSQQPLPDGLFAELMNKRRPIILSTDVDADKFPGMLIPGTELCRSLLIVPIVSGDRFLGAISIEDHQRYHAYGEEDVRLLTTIAASLGTALENARLFRETQEAKREADQAREEAMRANEAKSAFMSNMSHELRTPLNAIIGFTRIVKRKTEDLVPQKQTENLDKVLNSSEHLLGLINTILDIAKIEAGRMDVSNSRFPISQLIESTATISRPLLKPGVELHLDIAPGLPAINSDQDKIKQILLNLLSNAAKFTHEGSIAVTAQQAGDAISITVTDTGIGMNEEALGRVFEEFQQADATTRKKYGGTGLGMPISKHLAQLLGGDLTVASKEGQGSTFTLTLPIEVVSSQN